jgi:hypothetical protein
MAKEKKCLGFSVLLLCCLISDSLFAQYQPIQDYSLESIKGVRTDRGDRGMNTKIIDVAIQYEGFYRVFPHLWYDTGDEQPNEACYLTVVNGDGTFSTPLDSNAGPYKVVPDIPGTPVHHWGQPIDTLNSVFWRDGGLFYFTSGTNEIWMFTISPVVTSQIWQKST